MKGPSIDPERLAALLDGTLEEHDRLQLLSELARSEQDLEVLGDLAEVTRNMERRGTSTASPGQPQSGSVGATTEPDVPPTPDAARDGSPPGDTRSSAAPKDVAGVTHSARDAKSRTAVAAASSPVRVRASSRWNFLRGTRSWTAIAAGVLMLVSAGLLYRSRVRTLDPSLLVESPAEAVILLAAAIPASSDSVSVVPWPGVRGPDSDLLSSRARAIRFGAEAAALELAARERNARTAALLATDIADLFADLPAAGPAVAQYRRIADSTAIPAESLLARVHRGWDAAAPLFADHVARIGAWLAVARRAAREHDTGFFRRPASSRAVDALQKLLRGEEAATREALAQVKSATNTAPQDWAKLETDITSLLVALGT